MNIKEAICLKSFSTLINIEPKKLSYILYKIDRSKLYIQFEIPKKNGDKRLILAPKKSLKYLQKQLAKHLLDFCINQDRKLLAYGLNHEIRKNNKEKKKGYSIYSNAKYHQNKRYVFNFDLKDFFPSINFGRVRGYFIKNRIFNLNEKVSTLIAQIACHKNQLPQGSPCSPIISNLIAHLLDIKMIQIAKKYKCTYSRYIDDITFSTNKKDFPEEIAIINSSLTESHWEIGHVVKRIIYKSGFKINPKKTRMSYRDKRQTTTGLVVNKKINIRKEYYKNARAMVHHLCTKKDFYIPYQKLKKDISENLGDFPSLKTMRLEGILNHIKYTKNYDKKKEENKKADGYKHLIGDFVFLKNFVMMNKPVIMTEGKTDIMHLKLAIKKLSTNYPELINVKKDKTCYYKVKFFSDKTKTNIQMSKGISGLIKFIKSYEEWIKKYDGWKDHEKHPIIILVDGDAINKNDELTNNQKRPKLNSAYIKKGNITNNLYLASLPKGKCIEDLYDDKLQKQKLEGKGFIKENKYDKDKYYGKLDFFRKIIVPNFEKVDFSKFEKVLDEIKLYIS